MAVLIYARYSGSKQSKGNSIARQIEMAEEYAHQNGLTVTEPPFIDPGRSAFHAAHIRGKMGVLLKRAQSGKLGEGDIILVEMIDRMSREEVLTAWDQLRVFTNAGVAIITVADKHRLDAETFNKEWTRIIDPLAKMAGAHSQSKDKSIRTKDNWDRARKDGDFLTTAVPGWLNKDRSERPDRVETVRQIFDLYLGGDGAGVIAKKLNAVPVRAWGNGRKDTYSVWSSATVAKVLNSRAVMGECQPKSGGEIAGPAQSDYFPQIIDPDIFYKSQTILKSRAFGGQGSGRKSSANIFRGLALCGVCRCRMNITWGGGVRSLRCYGSKVGSCRNTRGFNYDKLEDAVLRIVSEIRITDDSSRLRGLQSDIASSKRDLETTQGNVDFLIQQSMEERSAAISKKAREEEAKLIVIQDRLDSLMGKLASAQSPLTQHHSEIVSAFDELALAEDQDEVRQRINMSLTALVDKIVMTGNHAVIISLKDHTTYRLGYRLKTDLPKQKRVGARSVSDFEWYAGRVSMDDMMAHWESGYAEMDGQADQSSHH